MSKPTSRVLAVLELLQASTRPVGGGELARRTGVDRRTVRRYVAHLVALGVPVQTRRGRDGGYLLHAGHQLPPMMFNAEEALALAVGLRAAGELGLQGITPAVASSQSKLSRVLPAPLRQRLAAIEQTVSLGLARSSGANGDAARLAALSAAAHMQQRVRLRYSSAAGHTTEREADIYGLAYRGGHWYAAGLCHLRTQLRAFRLDRIHAVEAAPSTFARPADFDVQQFLARSIATLPRLHQVQVDIQASLAEVRPAVAPELAELTATPRGVRLSAQADALDWVVRLLAGLPFRFRIHRPAALRRALAAHAAQLMEQAR